MALTIAVLAVNAPCQPPTPAADWANLNSLAPGSEIRVFLTDGRMLRGFVQHADADSLTINATTSQEKLPRSDVTRVQLKRQGHRGRNTLIGLGVGMVGGLAAGAVIDRNNSSGWFTDFGKAVFTPFGAIVGTVVGVAIPTGGWRQIYRAPKASSSGAVE